MTPLRRSALALALVALGAAACSRLNTPQKKAGYSLGEVLGGQLANIKDKVDFEQVYRGLRDQLAGTPAMKDEERDATLRTLQAPDADHTKVGYAVGLSIGQNLQPVAGSIDVDAVVAGVKDALAGKSKLSDTDRQAALQDLDQKRRDALSKKDQDEGAAFLAKNKALPGVQVTASGLQYQVLKAGHGRHPKATDTVTVNYVGTLVDGTKFDSSYDRHQSATFALNQVIPGWTEGLQLMNVGAKYRFVIPSALGYGASGAGAQIGPDAVLVFEVELLKIGK